MDFGRLIAAGSGGSYVVGMLIVALLGAAAGVTGIALIADVRAARASLTHRYSKVTGLPPATFVLPLRLLGALLSSLGLVVAVLALTNLG